MLEVILLIGEQNGLNRGNGQHAVGKYRDENMCDHTRGPVAE